MVYKWLTSFYCEKVIDYFKIFPMFRCSRFLSLILISFIFYNNMEKRGNPFSPLQFDMLGNLLNNMPGGETHFAKISSKSDAIVSRILQCA